MVVLDALRLFFHAAPFRRPGEGKRGYAALRRCRGWVWRKGGGKRERLNPARICISTRREEAAREIYGRVGEKKEKRAGPALASSPSRKKKKNTLHVPKKKGGRRRRGRAKKKGAAPVPCRSVPSPTKGEEKTPGSSLEKKSLFFSKKKEKVYNPKKRQTLFSGERERGGRAPSLSPLPREKREGGSHWRPL